MKCFRIISLVCTVLSLILSGCTTGATPPDISAVEKRFQEHYSDINIVVSFMIDSGYENIYINDTSGKMLAELERVDISSESVVAALSRLLKNGTYKSISKRRNTLDFLQWTSVREISCGIAYSINGADFPEVQYVTELYPISMANWYYYVADYNKWRAGSRP